MASWKHATKHRRSVSKYQAVMTRDLSSALDTEPSARTVEQIEMIYEIVKEYPFAQLIPVTSLKICCRYMTFEVLHDDMVRSSRTPLPALQVAASAECDP